MLLFTTKCCLLIIFMDIIDIVSDGELCNREECVMTTLRQSAMLELEKLPEDKLSFIIQIMQGVNGLYTDTTSERKEAFANLEKLRRRGTVTDYDAELASCREGKYGK